jgi:hypothetical protein
MLKIELSWEPVAYTCNPNYSGGRNQEDHGSKPAEGKYLENKPITKKGW